MVGIPEELLSRDPAPFGPVAAVGEVVDGIVTEFLFISRFDGFVAEVSTAAVSLLAQHLRERERERVRDSKALQGNVLTITFQK